MNSRFWRDRRVLLTGHTGFKGSWLSLWLQSLGAQVVGYSLAPPTEPNLFQLARVQDGMESTHGDVLDLEHLRRVMQKCRPEIVIHMAAQSLVRSSYADPVRTYAVNVMGTVHVLEAVRQTPSVRAVVVVTTDKCYQNRETLRPYCEDSPLGGDDPYSSSKACAEHVTAAYRKAFFATGPAKPRTGIASARAGNVIGGGDWAADRLISDVMRAVLDGKELVIRHPDAVRPWQHVLDPLSGYLTLAEKLYDDPDRFSDAWNFGPDESEALSVAGVLERLRTLWGPDLSWRIDDGPHPLETQYLQLSSNKARTALAWEPPWSLDSSLKETVRWYKDYRCGGDVRSSTQDQIRSYERSLIVPETSAR